MYHFLIFILYFGEKGLRDIKEKNLYYINKSCMAGWVLLKADLSVCKHTLANLIWSF